MITEKQKEAIRTLVHEFVEHNKGIRKAATKLGISKEAIRTILSGKWNLLPDTDWNQVKKALGI